MTRIGIDEAGLGPLLGPYCAGAVGFIYNKKISDPRESCSTILSSRRQTGTLAVGDSKYLYSRGKIGIIEETVLAFTELFTGTQPSRADAFLNLLSSGTFQEQSSALPWYEGLKKLKLPLTPLPELKRKLNTLKKVIEKQGIQPLHGAVSIQTVPRFNALLKSEKNKAAACQRILSPLVQDAVCQGDEVLIDRQGGRRFYGEWLADLFPGIPLRALAERKEYSRYEAGESMVEFRIKADAFYFETALASLFAKYSRELCMTAFNLWWQKQLPGLKGTAGYYRDGRRFIADLEEKGLLPENRDKLIRLK